jgi:hypothetical protein
MICEIKGKAVRGVNFTVWPSGIGELNIDTTTTAGRPQSMATAVAPLPMGITSISIEYKRGAYAKLTAQTDDESNMLGYLAYSSYCSNQYTVLFIPPSLLTPKVTP